MELASLGCSSKVDKLFEDDGDFLIQASYPTIEAFVTFKIPYVREIATGKDKDKDKDDFANLFIQFFLYI